MAVLEAKNLTKKFGKVIAVDNISFALKEGEILGMLGPNGAGKTTTLQMLLGLLKPSSGEVVYFGKKLDEDRSEILDQVNFSSAYTELPWLLSVRENLTFISYLYDIKDRKARLEKIRKTFQLEAIWNKEIHHLSAGQKTRVNLAKSFINFPKVLLLDEPTASLDPEVALFIREFLHHERKQFNVSIIITSHNMAEVEELCDRVIFIHHGKIISDDTPENLAKTIETAHLRLLVTEELRSKLAYLCHQQSLQYQEEGPYLMIDIKEKAIPGFLKILSDQKIDFEEISIERPTLEDYFLQTAKKV